MCSVHFGSFLLSPLWGISTKRFVGLDSLVCDRLRAFDTKHRAWYTVTLERPTLDQRSLFLLAISAPRTTVHLVVTSIRCLARPTWQPPARGETLGAAVLVPEYELESILVLLIQSKAKLLLLCDEVRSDDLGKPG